mgnify:CR=1 FL=1
MNIGKLNVDGEWLELEPENEKFGTLKVKVIPDQVDFSINVIRGSVAGYVKDLVVDWNLKREDVEIPCDKENKDRYIPIIANMGVKNPKYTDEKIRDKSVGSEIIAFSQNLENFTKN